MFSRAVVLARIGGIEVRLDPSLLLFALLVGGSLFARFTASYGTGTAVAMTAAGGLLFFGSILAHELGHAFEARHRGMLVHGVTLFVLGGVTEMHAEGQRPRDELAVAAVGPWVSVFCGAVFGLVATFVGVLLPDAVAAPVTEVAGLLGWLNVVLAVFNVVPGAPLDGGRMLRALLWWVFGDRRLALKIAVRVGQLLGLALVAYAAWGLLHNPAAIVPAGLLAIVGLFMFNAARRELRDSDVEALFEAWTVGALVGDGPPPVPHDRTLDLVDPQAAAQADLVPVTAGGSLVGLLRADTLRSLHPTERALRTAGELAEPVDDRPTVSADEDLHVLIDRFQGDATVVVVTRDGEPVRAVTEREVAVAIRRLRVRRTPPPPGDRGDATHGDVEVGG